jgi:hypothetical protein
MFMSIKRNQKLIVLALIILLLSLSVPAKNFRGGAQDNPVPGAQAGTPSTGALLRWNHIAIDASGLDHTPVAPGDNRVFGEQVGPGRASRAMAIVHIAMFEAMNMITGGYRSYVGFPATSYAASIDAAVAQAAHDTLAALFVSQKSSFDEKLAEDLAQIAAGQLKITGIALGQRAAKAILQMRAADHSQHPEPKMDIDYFPSDQPGVWRQDPVSHHPLALGWHWGEVTPFVLVSGKQYRVPPPPPMNSPEYTAAFNEAKALGGDGINTATQRTADQTIASTYWSYDGTPSLCAPPRLYNQITVHIANLKGTSGIQLARLLALVNTAMADAGIAIWESKYFYSFWRPVGGIREADPGTGPSGLGDSNPDTLGDVNFMPLGAPASNLTGPNFTPPFPSYPSGHAGFGGALFQVLRDFYGTDNIPFTFVSDEYNGVTVDNGGNIRPLIPRSFATLSQAEEENGQSRIYLGIHWSFDKTQGIAQGRNIGHYVFKTAFLPAQKNSK